MSYICMKSENYTVRIHLICSPMHNLVHIFLCFSAYLIIVKSFEGVLIYLEIINEKILHCKKYLIFNAVDQLIPTQPSDLSLCPFSESLSSNSLTVPTSYFYPESDIHSLPSAPWNSELASTMVLLPATCPDLSTHLMTLEVETFLKQSGI